MENVRLGIQMEGFQELREQSSGLGVDESKESQTNQQEQQAFYDLETCNEHHTGVVLFGHCIFMEKFARRGILHVEGKE